MIVWTLLLKINIDFKFFKFLMILVLNNYYCKRRLLTLFVLLFRAPFTF